MASILLDGFQVRRSNGHSVTFIFRLYPYISTTIRHNGMCAADDISTLFDLVIANPDGHSRIPSSARVQVPLIFRGGGSEKEFILQCMMCGRRIKGREQVNNLERAVTSIIQRLSPIVSKRERERKEINTPKYNTNRPFEWKLFF